MLSLSRVQKEPVNYVDVMIAAARRLAGHLGSARAWLAQADVTSHHGWRLAFLVEARRARDRAADDLGALEERLTEFGRKPPPPLDRIADKTATMRDELGALTESLDRMAQETPASGDA
jgi:HAMP domain-containing protein